jgi:hypothetical protein
MPHPHPAFTAHARLRLAQRGISLAAIDATLAWGRSFFARGVEFFRLDRRSVEEAMERGFDVSAYEGTHVVVGHGGIVVTTYRNRSGRRVRR